MGIKKVHVITKTIWHCLIGLIEIVVIPVGIALLTTHISPFECENMLWQLIERSVFCFFFYEAILIYIRKMQIDTKNDALLALKTAHEKALLYCETGSSDVYSRLISEIDEVLDNGVLNQLDVIRSYSNLKQYIETKNTIGIKNEIINIEHSMSANELLWNYTLILRFFK